MEQITPVIIEKIVKYFQKNYVYSTILVMLEKKYRISISSRTLKRILKNQGCCRRNVQESSMEDIVACIHLELEGSGYNLGYRATTARLRNVYISIVEQKTVLKVLRIMDPKGVEGRRRYRLKRRKCLVPGPNYIWHADGHDKLKRYGFAIHGCIDGFSKKVIWLEVASSNNDPAIIAFYYLETIQKFGYLPALIRTDHGTENTLIEDLHTALRYNHQDDNAGLKSFIKGKSTHNQRIESFWRLLRRKMGDFYIQLFRAMQHNNLLDINNALHINCQQFCFGQLIKAEISITKKEWNQHKIRKQNSADIIGGIPNELFHYPVKYNAVDNRKRVGNKNSIRLLKERYTKVPKLCSREFEELVQMIAPNVEIPCTAEEACNLYLKLIDTISKVQSP